MKDVTTCSCYSICILEASKQKVQCGAHVKNSTTTSGKAEIVLYAVTLLPRAVVHKQKLVLNIILYACTKNVRKMNFEL
jgi:hypothetical protein